MEDPRLNLYKKYNAPIFKLLEIDENDPIVSELFDKECYVYLNSRSIISTMNHEDLLAFIEKHKEGLISGILQDYDTKDNLLQDNDRLVDLTKSDKLTKEFIGGLLHKIKTKECKDIDVNKVFEFIVKIIEQYKNNFDDKTIDEILKNGIYSIVNNNKLMSEDGCELEKEEKISATKLLLRWNETFGNKILPQVGMIMTLKERVEQYIENNGKFTTPYIDDLKELLKNINKAVDFLDSKIEPQKEDVAKINNIFEDYNTINKTIFADAIKSGEYQLIHFVQTERIKYIMTPDGPKSLNESEKEEEAIYNNPQNDLFIKDYYSMVVKQIEKEYGEPFDIKNPKHVFRAQEYLDAFCNTFNSEPLSRYGVASYEFYDYKQYKKPAGNRLSCGFFKNGMISSHIGRTVGLDIDIDSIDAIETVSCGYTAEKQFFDFDNDAVTFDMVDEILERGLKHTNEIILDCTKVKPKAILLYSDDEQAVEKANLLSHEYQVPIKVQSQTQRY